MTEKTTASSAPGTGSRGPHIDINEIRMKQTDGLTCGVIPRNGFLRERKEIDDFLDDNDMTNIFMVALDDLMKRDWRDPFSYFQIAGIHGKPFTAWNGVQPHVDGNARSGYCSHSSILFPTWHRAYLMMFEQALYLRMVDLAHEYPEPYRSRYLEAANKFGLPYWDPFLPRRKLKNIHGYYFYQTGLPVIMTVKEVMVRYKDNPATLTPMPNPLSKYNFPTASTSPRTPSRNPNTGPPNDDYQQEPQGYQPEGEPPYNPPSQPTYESNAPGNEDYRLENGDYRPKDQPAYDARVPAPYQSETPSNEGYQPAERHYHTKEEPRPQPSGETAYRPNPPRQEGYGQGTTEYQPLEQPRYVPPGENPCESDDPRNEGYQQENGGYEPKEEVRYGTLPEASYQANPPPDTGYQPEGGQYQQTESGRYQARDQPTYKPAGEAPYQSNPPTNEGYQPGGTQYQEPSSQYQPVDQPEYEAASVDQYQSKVPSNGGYQQEGTEYQEPSSKYQPEDQPRYDTPVEASPELKQEVRFQKGTARPVQVTSLSRTPSATLPLQPVQEVLPQMDWDQIGDWPLAMRENTIRGVNQEGQADIAFVNRSLDYALSHSIGHGVSLGGKLYRILLGPSMSYNDVSNSAFHPELQGDEEKESGQNSIEGFHNDIHVLAGGGPGEKFTGHMALNEYAAFDPLFWLHHCNVDRLMAIWQALNPTKWFDGTPQTLDSPTFAAKAGSIEDIDTPLYPFRRHGDPHQPGWSNWTWWTSRDLQEISKLGYNYPQIPNTKDEARISAEVTKYVTMTLEWSTIGGAPPAFEDPGFTPLLNLSSGDFTRHEMLPRSLEAEGGLFTYVHRELHQKAHNRIVAYIRRSADWCRERLPGGVPRRYKHISGLISKGQMYQWNATIQVEKFALGGSFTIFLFLGDPGDCPWAWPHDRNMIGSDGVFAAQSRDHCSNCQEQYARRLLDSDTIPLTPPLISYWRTQESLNGLRVESLDPEDVRNFLKWNLHWRIIDRNGTVYSPDATPELARSLKVQVSCQLVTLPRTPTCRPEFGIERVYPDITSHKRGGLHYGERFSRIQYAPVETDHQHSH